jgi:hypothetical protein
MKQPQQSFYIYSCALGHYNLAAPAYYDDALLISANMAVVANMAFCVELLLKCSDSKVTQSERHPDGPIAPATIGSNAWGHDLIVVFDKLDTTVSSHLAELFEQETGQPIRPLLLKCKDYFQSARYYFSSKQPSYDVSGIKLLADGLIMALHKGYGGPPPPSPSSS